MRDDVCVCVCVCVCVMAVWKGCPLQCLLDIRTSVTKLWKFPALLICSSCQFYSNPWSIAGLAGWSLRAGRTSLEKTTVMWRRPLIPPLVITQNTYIFGHQLSIQCLGSWFDLLPRRPNASPPAVTVQCPTLSVRHFLSQWHFFSKARSQKRVRRGLDMIVRDVTENSPRLLSRPSNGFLSCRSDWRTATHNWGK